MNVVFAYYKQSGLSSDGVLSLAPNLSREPVSFDAELRQPLKFREAISALHDVVINDLRFKPRDHAAYEEYKKQENRRLAEIRRSELKTATAAILARREEPMPADLESRYERSRRTYWDARLKYSNYLARHDQEMWRLLMPCDPIVTVADDVCYFECFSADESSYGCLTVDREATFGPTPRRNSERRTLTTPGIFTITFRSCGPIATLGFASTRKASKFRSRGTPTIAKKKSIFPPAGCAG
ncbi:MAG: hypothetical protein QM775_11275 [Pirellulales bacterium]